MHRWFHVQLNQKILKGRFGAGQQLLSAEKSHFATHVDITVKMILEFQNIKAKKVSKMENKT